MYRSSKNKMIRRIGLSSVAAATALGLGITVANATTTHSTGTQAVAAKALAGHADGPDGGFGHFNALEVHGTISALDASSVTLTDPAGTATTYSLASGLTVTKNHVAATLADLTVGQRVEARLTAAGSTTINSIDIDVARLMGQVTAVSGSTITVSSPRGTATFNTTGSTSYTLDGVAASASDLTVGKFVMAIGDSTSTPTNFTAVSVAISTTAPVPHDGGRGDHGFGQAMGPMAGGQVTAVSGSTITVTDPRGNTDIITVDGSTTYTFNGAAGNLGEVTVGSFVFAKGTSTGAGALTASSVAISTTAPAFGHPGDGDGQGQFGDH